MHRMQNLSRGSARCALLTFLASSTDGAARLPRSHEAPRRCPECKRKRGAPVGPCPTHEAHLRQAPP